jgi:hypothetical protein
MHKKNALSVLCGLAFVYAVAGVSGGNLLRNGGAEDGNADWIGAAVTSAAARTGKSGIELSAPGDQKAVSGNLIPVDGTGRYALSGFIRTRGATPCRVLLGLAPYDGEKRPIASTEVNIVPGTDTVLAEACEPELTSLNVTP